MNNDLNELNYYKNYLNEQKYIFDTIDNIIMKTLKEHNLETYSIYDFIGHEFLIYYSLYGEEVSLDNESIYLAHNWDNEASLNSNILIYVEDNMMKMCNYSLNPDGSITCYDANGEINNITNGVSLSKLTEVEIFSSCEGYLKYYHYPEAIRDAISDVEITADYNVESIINSNSYLYLDNNSLVVCSCTTNQNGEVIPYIIYDNKVYLLSENARKIGSLKELYEEEILTYDENNKYDIDNDKLEDYLKNKEISKRR